MPNASCSCSAVFFADIRQIKEAPGRRPFQEYPGCGRHSYDCKTAQVPLLFSITVASSLDGASAFIFILPAIVDAAGNMAEAHFDGAAPASGQDILKVLDAMDRREISPPDIISPGTGYDNDMVQQTAGKRINL